MQLSIGRIVANKRLFLSGLVIVLILVGFWGGSRYPALDDKASMGGVTRLEDPLSFEAVFQIQAGDGAGIRVLYTTANWVNTNKQGMLFGVFLAAAVLTLLGYLRRRSFKSSFANTLMGFVIGTPMGVCVNCAAPVARGLHKAGARLETSLATLFSSPTMNIVVLTMLFTIFPMYLALTKLAATFFLLFVLIPLLSRYVFHSEVQDTIDSCAINLSTSHEVFSDERWHEAGWSFLKNYGKNLWFIVSKTVPLMFVAGLLGAVVATFIPLQQFATSELTLYGLLIVVLVGTFLPVPIAFDIVVASALLTAGLPIAYVMALLFTLGTYSVYPFMLLWKGISMRVAATLYVVVMMIGFAAGLIADSYREYEMKKIMNFFIEEAQAEEFEESGWPEGINIGSAPHSKLGIEIKEEKNFTRIEGEEIGLSRPNNFRVSDYWPPFYYGRGIASGDINNDGWEDIAVPTEQGVALFANQKGKAFSRQEIDVVGLNSLNVFIVALVDIDNDGWQDIYLTSYGKGNYYILNNKGEFDGSILEKIPSPPEILTLGLSFGDVDRDGDLDAAIGNWYYGWPKEIPTAAATNQLHINDAGKFLVKPFEDTIVGETLSMLFSDLNQDGNLDLMVSNDFDQPDSFYFGDDAGELNEVFKEDNIIPVSTHTTMSFDTADINNDLSYEMYIAQIAGRPGEQARRIPSRHIREYCADIVDPHQKQVCMANISIRKFYRLSPTSSSEMQQCQRLMELDEQKNCKAMMIMKAAVLGRQKDICEKIPVVYGRQRTLCFNAFETRVETTEEEYRRAVPQKRNQNVLLFPSESGQFSDRAEEYGVDVAGWSWNAKFADLDNDEWQDIYVANGILRRMKLPTNFFFHNNKGENFIEETAAFGLQNFMSIPSYTYVDYDRDGDLDIVMNTVNGPLWLYRNNIEAGASVLFDLRDELGNAFGVGSQITIKYGSKGERHQIREIKAGGGYASFDAPVAHFGLGVFSELESVTVQWSTGEETILDGPFAANKRYIITRRR